MNRDLEYPLLRWPVEIRQDRLQDQDLLILSCPLGLTAKALVLRAGIAPVLAHFRGELSIVEIAAKFAEYGVTGKFVEELAKLLDDHYFLAGKRYETEKQRVEELFRSSPIRQPALAGLGYSDDPEKLAAALEGYLSAGRGANGPPPSSLLAVIAPHIDYRRGSTAYGNTYRHLRGADHTLYILLGTAHQYNRHPFHLTEKDFLTPLGPLPCDKEFVRGLAAQHGHERSFAGEFLHQREHSLELQTPFLKYLAENAKIVPILVGGCHDTLMADPSKAKDEEYTSFIDALAACTRERMAAGQKVCFIAGVDLAHVGSVFGDSEPLSPALMGEIEQRDRLLLDALQAQSKDRLLAHIREDGDARRICGFPALYVLLDLFDRLELRYDAQLFDYRQAVDYEGGCGVTFCGMGLYRRPGS